MPPARQVLLALAYLALLAPAASAQELDLPEVATASIEVQGEGSMTARNDAARVTFGMEARRRTSAAALRVSARRARRVIARLRAAGIEGRDIRTLAVRLTRHHRNGRVAFVVVRNSVRVTVRDVSRAGAIVDQAVAAGATDVDGPFFFVSDRRALYRQALLAAFDDARAKAEALADRADVLLGDPIRIREGSSDEAFSEGQSGGGGRRLNRTPTRPGTSRVDATVTVEFAIVEF